MMNIIKTAVVTIIISIISGLLVEYFKNIAPRILCNISSAVPTQRNNKRVYAYIITVSNLSKKIIHELTLNVQGSKGSIDIAHAKITKGLKFESSVEDNILDIYIPFLSKGDKFSITVYVESPNKPAIVMRSPENFKKLDSIKQKGKLSSLFDGNDKNSERAAQKVSKTSTRKAFDEKNDFTMVMNNPLGDRKENTKAIGSGNNLSKVKKIMIVSVPLILIVLVGVLIKFYFNGSSSKPQNSNANTGISGKSNNQEKSSEENEQNNKPVKAPTYNARTNSDSKPSQGETTPNKSTSTQQNVPPKSTDTKPSEDTGGSTSNTNSDATSGGNDTKSQSGKPSENGNSNNSPGGANTNTNTNTSSNTSTSGTDQNSGK